VAPSAAITLTPTLVESQFPVVPHPGEAALAVLAQSPNGSSVVDWIAQLVRQDAAAVGGDIEAASAAPSPVLAISHLSGSINPQSGGRDSRAALVGMTLATTSTEVIQALMESVAYDLCLTQQLLADSGVGISTLRAAGGGTRSSWWMQLKADLTNTPVEVVEQPEPGTFGAALLAGAAVGIYGSAGLASEALVKIERRHEPDEQRRSLHAERMAAYWEAVAALLPLHRRLAHD
jgi:xylulokinase